MAEEKPKQEKIKEETKEVKAVAAPASEEKPKETKPGKSEKKKPEVKEIKPKDSAVVRGVSLRISSKYCFAICRMIKGKSPERAIEMLEQVVKEKLAVSMPQRELAHRPGKGMAGGRYPKKASLEIIHILKQLKANAIINGIDNPIITIAKANKASRPFKSKGRRAKRTHVFLEVKERTKLNKIKKKEKK